MVIRLAFLTAGLLGQLSDQLTVHEWGAFTSVANSDGTIVKEVFGLVKARPIGSVAKEERSRAES